MTDVAYILLAYNWLIQGLSVALGLIGCAFSIWAVVDAQEARLRLIDQGLDGRRLSLLTNHFVTHGGILAVQIILTVISLMAATLPEVPEGMVPGLASANTWVVTVIVTRKLLRICATGILLWVAAYKVYWVRRLTRLLREEQTAAQAMLVSIDPDA